MPLATGTRLGPYEILAAIGAGGMGEVYKARDTRLDRIVAIKVLPTHLADEPDLRERFEREARTVASLNHPHICVLHDIGNQDGISYLVMEFLEGETLAQRLLKGPLPLDQVFQYAIEIADALDRAHRKGVTHRDLKPGNIMLAKSGSKLLDFGLAKLTQAASPVAGPLSQLPTVAHAITAQGTIVGTLQYMAPEQLEAKEADARTDIFAFGVVVYEMATGKKAFEGQSQASLIAKILETDPPPISSSQSMTPPALDRAVKKCLAKEPEKRWQSASDLTDELRWITEGGSQVTPLPGAPSVTRRKTRERLLAAIAAIALVAAGILAAIHFGQKPPVPPEVIRFQIRLPDKVSFGGGTSFTLSPDGRHLAFSAIGPSGKPAVWLQDMDAQEARELPDTETGPAVPPFFWSPDSRFVVFSGNSTKLRKADIIAGGTLDICDKPGPPVRGSWNRDGVIIFGTNTTGLWRVAAAGGTAVPLTTLDSSRNEREHELPSFLPDGKHFLYLRISNVSEQSGIFAGSLDDPPERQSMKRILATGFGAYYVPAPDGSVGHLLFWRDSTLMAQKFDPSSLELSGDPTPVAERVAMKYETAAFSASSNVLVYRTATPNAVFQLTWFDRQGKILGKVGDPGPIDRPRLSPDGTQVVFGKGSQDDDQEDLWLLDLTRGTTTRFTFGPARNVLPVWSPDGKEIVFASNRDGVFNLYRKAANGANEEQLLLKTDQNKRASSWSRDGRFLLYSTSQGSGFNSQEDVWALPMQGDHTPIPLLRTQFDENLGEFSPDGKWYAYVSNESGRREVYVRGFAASSASGDEGGEWLVSQNGGINPAWRADGKELCYIGPSENVMTVSVDTSHSFQIGVPQILFALPAGVNSLTVAPYGFPAHTADLKRFVLPIAADQGGPSTFTVLVNWVGELNK